MLQFLLPVPLYGFFAFVCITAAPCTQWWAGKIPPTKPTIALTKMSWQVMVMWECSLKKDTLQKTLVRMVEKLQ
jgi:G:T-mismatch repair DNA endonuclease (very short patch repair protein)